MYMCILNGNPYNIMVFFFIPEHHFYIHFLYYENNIHVRLQMICVLKWRKHARECQYEEPGSLKEDVLSLQI